MFRIEEGPTIAGLVRRTPFLEVLPVLIRKVIGLIPIIAKFTIEPPCSQVFEPVLFGSRAAFLLAVSLPPLPNIQL